MILSAGCDRVGVKLNKSSRGMTISRTRPFRRPHPRLDPRKRNRLRWMYLHFIYTHCMILLSDFYMNLIAFISL